MPKKKDHQYPSMPKTYSLLKEIQADPLYKSNVGRRDTQSRRILEGLCETVNPDKLLAGNLYMFHYYTPKTAEDLKYYDAMPCSIFFGRIKTKEGEPRVLAFNLHYYPPKVRFRVLGKVMDIYKDFYRSAWKTGLDKNLADIDYGQLLDNLERAKLAFGVRMYIPDLIGASILVPPSLWHLASFSEGRFRKVSREAIMNYWRQYKI